MNPFWQGSAANIQFWLDRLNVLGSVLVIGAHPDDENNALLAYLARGRKLRTGYLSLTRGEGGGNAIGAERAPLLGVIRTQELLAARRIDGAEQFFTRSSDFGFSKTAAHTLEKWGKKSVLGDIVWVIRSFRPDVIVQCFTGTAIDGHGHHQACGQVGQEAYSVAADPAQFAELGLPPWQARRMLLDARTFLKRKDPENGPAWITLDVGEYSPLAGKSFAELGVEAGCQHKSAAQGRANRLGTQLNTLLPMAGEAAVNDLFDGIDVSWRRLNDGDEVAPILEAAASGFVPSDPAQTVPRLLQARPLIERILQHDQTTWARQKLGELDETIAQCAGIRADASCEVPLAVPGKEIEVTLSALNRSSIGVHWPDVGRSLEYNQIVKHKLKFPIGDDAQYSRPPWLIGREAQEEGRHAQICNAASAPRMMADFDINVAGQNIHLRREIEHRWVDLIEGELASSVAVVPPVSVRLVEKAMVFANGGERSITLEMEANVADASGEAWLELDPGWDARPRSQPFQLHSAGEQAMLTFRVKPGSPASRISAVARVQGILCNLTKHVIRYSHIPAQTVLMPAEAKAVNVAVSLLAKNIGYVMGAGDEVPAALNQLGATVTVLARGDLAHCQLAEFDAIVTGVRAYNVCEDLRVHQQQLLEYICSGGTLVVQYNIAEGGPYCRGKDTGELANIGPYPLKIGCDRVTMEDAPVRLLKPDCVLLNTPNRITDDDFTGWVQDRGMHFACAWDQRYETIIESHDAGEVEHPGGMLLARCGQGAYIYTGYSWFKQLPAGVPGAYRIFANLVSAGKSLHAERQEIVGAVAGIGS